MKNVLKFLAIAAVILGFSANSFGQASVSATASATGTIVTPLAITKSDDMNFGNVATNGTAGTVVLTPASTRTATGGVTVSAAMGGVITAASFAVTGEGTYTYAITLPTTATTVTRNSGTETMTVDAFTSTPSATGALTAGAQTLNVGATLNVGTNQVAGTYTSTTPFTVTICYN